MALINPLDEPCFFPIPQEDVDSVPRMESSEKFQAYLNRYKSSGETLKPPVGTKYLKPSEGVRLAGALTKDITEAYHTLRHIMAWKESVIRKRWAKKTKEQRKRIMQAAFPSIPVEHRSDLREILNFSTASQENPAFTLPHMSVEDLLPVNRLPLFLNARGRNLPYIFAHADGASFAPGDMHQKIPYKAVKGHMMLLAGHDFPKTYGQLVRLSHEEQFIEAMHRKFRWFDPMTGFIILEVQQSILDFLVRCCAQILPDMLHGNLTSSSFPTLPEPPKIHSAETSYSQSATIAAEAPYRVPAQLDTARLLNLIEAKRTAAEDHIWDLREDPSHFAMVVSCYAEHHPERLPDQNGKMLDWQQSDSFWSDTLRLTVKHGYTSFFLWDVLYQKSSDLHRVVQGTFERFDPWLPLPEDVRIPICQMLCALRSLLECAMEQLAYAQMGCAKLGLHRKCVPADADVTVRFSTEGDYLLKLLHLAMDRHGEDTQKIGYHTVVNELQRLLDQDMTQKKRLSSFALETFSEFALISTIESELQALFPWAADFDGMLRARGYYDKRPATDLRTMHSAVHAHSSVRFDVRNVMPVSTKFYYPVDKAHNAKNVEAVRRAELNLDTSWNIVDTHFSDQSGETLHQIFGRYASQAREIRRTSPWIAPDDVQQTMPQIVNNCNEAFESSFATLGIEPDQPRRFQGDTTPQEKVKTRPQNTRPESGPALDQTKRLKAIPEVSPPTKPQISARALKVFRTTFHTYGTSPEHQGEIDWKDMLHAMTSMGFAANKLYGSVWHFVPTVPEIQKSIHLHEPHPTSKITFWTARAYGRRLRSTFGWSGEMFSE